MAQFDWFNFADKHSKFVNDFQYEFNCCGGSDGYAGWIKTKPDTLKMGAFPLSCCQVHLNADANIKWCSYQDVETKVMTIIIVLYFLPFNLFYQSGLLFNLLNFISFKFSFCAF